MDKSVLPVNQIAARSPTCYEFSNPDGAVVVEIEDEDTSFGTVEKQIKNLKLNYQFNEKDVPRIFKTLINNRMNGIKNILLKCYYSHCLLEFDDLHIRFERKDDNWKVTYDKIDKTIKTVDPEKSIVDHFWFVLKNPNIKLELFAILASENSKAGDRRQLDSKQLTTLLQSMIDSIDHHIETNVLDCERFNEDTFLSMLKHVKPGTLSKIKFDISWEKEENYQKMREIVETDQWNQAKHIVSLGVTPLKIDDLFHCEKFWLELSSVTPEDILRVVEHVFNSSSRKTCKLSCEHKKYDIDAVIDFLRSQNDGSRITKAKSTDPTFECVYEIVKSDKRVLLVGEETYICIITN